MLSDERRDPELVERYGEARLGWHQADHEVRFFTGIGRDQFGESRCQIVARLALPAARLLELHTNVQRRLENAVGVFDALIEPRAPLLSFGSVLTRDVHAGQ